MCLAIYKPAGVSITREYLENGMLTNSHGAGLAAAKNGKLVIRKGYWQFSKFWPVYQKFEHLPMLIHFRLATSGQKNERNCHPFKLSRDIALIHNGVIGQLGNAELSDTGELVESILGPLVEWHESLLDYSEFVRLVELAIGSSKLVMLAADGRHWIINENDGHWNNGAWYSNYSYQSFGRFWPAFDTDYDEEEEEQDIVEQEIQRDIDMLQRSYKLSRHDAELEARLQWRDMVTAK